MWPFKKKNSVESIVSELTKIIDKNSNPNINALNEIIRDIEVLRLNSKNFGHHIAKELHKKLIDQDISPMEPQNHNIVSKPTTQKDMESSWFLYWCKEIKVAPIYHRKLWEHAFILQVLYENNLIKSDVKGIGFGCGQEPLPSYFASKNIKVIASDLDPKNDAARAWIETDQHSASKEIFFFPDLVDRSTFDSNVEHRFIDMNNIPNLGEKFDFCWSVCAMEHLGSIKKGLNFVENSLSILKPGGIAIHTTEFNYLYDDKTIDNWGSVLFRKKDFMALSDRLKKSGHTLIGPDFDTGNGVLDMFIDVPPFGDKDKYFNRETLAHLKVDIDGFPATCFGLIIRKK